MGAGISISKTLTVRECGLDEYWLQSQIADNPAILGLGDLELARREKQQSRGGRLDLLLKNPEDDTMYEVEVMLGPTDESHIIRTIEYWDLEKRRWPQRQHFAVLVAESFARRFFNVIQLLGLSIPIVAVQANLRESNGQRSLDFTTILDTYEEPEEEIPSSNEIYDEAAWLKKSPATVACAKAMLATVKTTLSAADLRFFKFGLAIFVGKRNYFNFLHKDGEKSLLKFWIEGANADKARKLLEQEGLLPIVKSDRLRLLVDTKTIEAHASAFAQLAILVDEAWAAWRNSKESNRTD